MERKIVRGRHDGPQLMRMSLGGRTTSDEEGGAWAGGKLSGS